MADLTHAQELKLDALTETIWTLINEDGIDPEIILGEVETAIDSAGENTGPISNADHQEHEHND